ncbi:MAG: murein L,D-transpeptidase catalytic domain family protein [Gammaproteobacteria bacterium]|nr:murein L,D-transpeptidase catalytic domain family protein [Gammaproteobacteria bacterium]
MQNKATIITTLIISFMLMSTTLFYASSASCSHHKRHLRIPTHIRLPVITQSESDNKWDVNPRVWNLALKAYNNAMQKGYIKQKVVTIIDYSLPSSVKRMWVVDVGNKKVLYHTLVAHGKFTGGLFAKHFSNKPGSRASSIGTFITENTYMGSNGYSLRLRGLEPGFNERAESRAIVVHGAWYATQNFASHHGRLGLSWGCPAVSPLLAKPIINHIKNGTLVFAYYPDTQWLEHSRFLAANSMG